MMMTCIIVEDERLARIELIRMLKISGMSIEILAEAKNAVEAKEMIERLRPDFIFLDIQLPEQTGIDLLALLEYRPKVIFITAYDEYATKAFELNAVDYLMKPISQERLQRSIARMHELLHQKDQHSSEYLQLLYLTKSKNILIVKSKDIHYIESIGNYAQVYSTTQKGLLKTSLNQLSEQLDPAHFFRINRTIIIRVDSINKIIPKEKVLEVILNNGQNFLMSERKSVEFKRRTKV